MNNLGIFGLIFLSCLMHVSWNAISKGCKDREAFTWMVTLTGTLGVIPWFVYSRIHSPGPIDLPVLSYAAASGFFQALYFIFLFWSYQHVDVSVAYPLSRGIAPVATLFLGSMVGDPLRLAHVPGVVATLAGVSLLSWDAMQRSSSRHMAKRGLIMSVITGIVVAAYHLLDRGAMTLARPPVGVEYMQFMHVFMLFFISLWLLPKAGVLPRLRQEWRQNWLPDIFVGVVSFLAYLLVVIAFRYGHVTLVTAGRNMGIVISLAVGALFLREKISLRQTVGALLITAGVVVIFLGGKQ